MPTGPRISTIQAQPNSENIRKTVDEQIREENMELERLRATAGVEFWSYDTLLFRSCFGGSLHDDTDFLKSIDKVVELYSNRSSTFEKNENVDYTSNELKYLQVIAEMVKVLHPIHWNSPPVNRENEYLGLVVAMARIMHSQAPVENKNRKWTPIVYAVLNTEVFRLCKLLAECLDSDTALKKMVQEEPWKSLLNPDDDDNQRLEDLKKHYLISEEKYEELSLDTRMHLFQYLYKGNYPCWIRFVKNDLIKVMDDPLFNK